MRSAPRRRTRGSFPVASTTVEASASGAIGPPSTASAASPESSASAACTVSAFGCPEWFALVWASGQPIRRKTARTSGWSGTRNPVVPPSCLGAMIVIGPGQCRAASCSGALRDARRTRQASANPPRTSRAASKHRDPSGRKCAAGRPRHRRGRPVRRRSRSAAGPRRGPGERFENGVRRSIDAGFGQFQHTGHPIRPPRPAGRAPSAAPARRGSSR